MKEIDLVKFWRRYPYDTPPFAHPEDLPALTSAGLWRPENEPDSFEGFVNGPRFGNSYDNSFHFSLFPVPYAGDLRNAPVVILLLNPGFRHAEYWAEFKIPELRARLKLNIQQSFDNVEYPFLFLDPDFCWHGGFIWWEEKLRDVIRRIADVRFFGNYLSALKFLSRNLACLELIPYHSSAFSRHDLIETLPSALQARKFLHDHLIRPAIDGNRTVIVTRQQKGWGVMESQGDLVVYSGGHARGASLSASSAGGQAILGRFGIADDLRQTTAKPQARWSILDRRQNRQIPNQKRLYTLIAKPSVNPKGKQSRIILEILTKAKCPISCEEVAAHALKQGLRAVGGIEASCSYHLKRMVKSGIVREIVPE